MSSVNKAIIVGRLGQNPEMRRFNNGGCVATLSVATSEKWTDKHTGEPKEQTEWHRVSLYNRLGEIAAQYLSKGSLVYVEGSLHTRRWTDNSGIERYTTEIRADSMRMLGGGRAQGQGHQSSPSQQAQQPRQQGASKVLEGAPMPSPSTSMQRPAKPPAGAPKAAPQASDTDMPDDDMPF